MVNETLGISNARGTAIKLSEEEDNAAILKYAIKTLSGNKLTDNAKKLSAKRIMHLAVLYPYLLSLMDKYVFDAYNVDVDQIKAFADSVFSEARKINNYEGVCYSIYFALKYGFWLSEEFDNWAVERGDCITLVLTWLYYLKANHGNKRATQMKPLKAEALRLKDSDMDRYWPFCYEALSSGELDGEWVEIKKSRVCFIKSEFLTKPKKSESKNVASTSVNAAN